MSVRPIKVFLVDDSAVVRQVLHALLSSYPDLQVTGVASDPLFALEKMARDWPDVIVLDLEMPRMDGITFLRKLMAERPTPVVVCSSLSERGAQATLQAMAAGAVEVIAKPGVGVRDFLEASAEVLATAIRGAAGARPSAAPRMAPRSQAEPVARLDAGAILPPPGRAPSRTTERIVAIGASTGGTQAIEHVLTRLPHDCPAIAIVQHMPEKFTAALAQRLNGLCAMEVREAADGDRLVPGLALIAPGGRHLAIRHQGGHYLAQVIDGPAVSRHRPSVDVLFRSVATCAGRNACGVLMTGMGDDGARGLLEMREAGADTAAQDRESCVVFGMPREAIRLGAARRVLALADIPRFIGSEAARGAA